MVPATQTQQVALQFARTSNSIATAEQLAELIANPSVPRYKEIGETPRRKWLGDQILALNYLAHSTRMPDETDLTIESSLLDQAIMDDEGLRCLTAVEMQEAFRKGIAKEYGEFYGITTASLIDFLKGFRNCEKRRKAIAILYNEDQKRLKEEDELFWKELNAAREKGFEIPTFQSSPFENDQQHRRRIAKQREEILKRTKQ